SAISRTSLKPQLNIRFRVSKLIVNPAAHRRPSAQHNSQWIAPLPARRISVHHARREIWVYDPDRAAPRWHSGHRKSSLARLDLKNRRIRYRNHPRTVDRLSILVNHDPHDRRARGHLDANFRPSVLRRVERLAHRQPQLIALYLHYINAWPRHIDF